MKNVAKKAVKLQGDKGTTSMAQVPKDAEGYPTVQPGDMKGWIVKDQKDRPKVTPVTRTKFVDKSVYEGKKLLVTEDYSGFDHTVQDAAPNRIDYSAGQVVELTPELTYYLVKDCPSGFLLVENKFSDDWTVGRAQKYMSILEALQKSGEGEPMTYEKFKQLEPKAAEIISESLS